MSCFFQFLYSFFVFCGWSTSTTQPARNVLGTSPEGTLKVLTSGTSRGTSRDSQETNTKTDDLMKKKRFLDVIVLVLHIHSCFLLEKKKYSKGLNGAIHGTFTRPSCWTSRGPYVGTFWGRSREVGHTCFLNSTHKHIKLTLRL